MQGRVLIVDDNAVDREAIRRRLGDSANVQEAATGADGLDRARLQSMACVLLDHRLPDAEGVDLVSSFVELGAPVVMLTGQGSERVAVEAMKRGALDYLIKDQLTDEGLRRAVRHAVDTAALEVRLRQQRSQLERHVAELALRSHQLENSNAALQASEHRLRIVLEQLPAIVWTTDGALKYTSLAGATCRALGIDPGEVVGSSVVEHHGDAQAVEAHRRALAGTPVRYDLPWGARMLEACVEPLRGSDGSIEGVIGFGLDVTESRQIADRLRQAQKMEAVGTLAGGVAHDFNNLLTAIQSFTQFAADGLDDEDPAREDLDQVQRAVDRAAELTRQLLAFSRNQRIEPRSLDVGEVVQNLEKMLRRLIQEDVELETHVAEGLWRTSIDPGSLEQVIMNLVVNARDAMPEGGQLTIELENVELAEGDPSLARHQLTPGDYVLMAVSDTGEGVAPELQDSIFEPFFTTKDVGKGTGLGLSTCHGIIRQAEGNIWVYSEPGRGSTFKVVLPRTVSGPSELIRQAAAPVELDGTERILVVEDDDQVRALAVRALTLRGYRVVEAANGAAALLRMQEYGEPIDLLLTDVVMPQMSGPDLAKRLGAKFPELRVVYMSGYTARVATQQRLLPADVPLLAKPFSPRSLLQRVRELLDGPTLQT